MVLLLTWYGPVPWCHCHAAAGTASETYDGRATFDRHLDRYHASLDRTFAETLGWHLHWTLPGDRLLAAGSESTLPDAPSSSSESDDGAAASLRQVLHSVEHPPLAPFVALDSSADSPASPPSGVAPRPAHFYDGFAPTLSLPRRFSIARC